MLLRAIRSLFLLWSALALLVSNAAAGTSVVQDATRHCEHQDARQHGQHQTPAPDCGQADSCSDCATPACRDTTHCGGSSAGVPEPATGRSSATAPDRVIGAPPTALSSLSTAPPTHPPLLGR